MIRKALQSGWGRKPIALLMGVGLAAALFFKWDTVHSLGINPLAEFTKAAFVAAAFSVTAYNLRIRVLDLILKMEGQSSRVNKLCQMAQNCGQRLTNLVLLFTLTACGMAAGGLIFKDSGAAKWIAAVILFLFSSSTIHFFYILFAFERLERFILDDFSAKAASKEVSALLNLNQQ